ncbi:MAG: DedA family protein [Saprospiraceae bacterium]|nr:DedA family protein [Saprospiraceae bacterium]
MEIIIEFFQHITNPDWIMHHGGMYLVLLIIFLETGLFFGFFLPGDVLLFISGMVIAVAEDSTHIFSNDVVNLIFWQVLFICGTIAGNFFGYWFGSKFGPILERQQKDYWLLKRNHLAIARNFYNHKGGIAVCIARFIPIARTFVPIIAGLVKMDYKKFSFYNILGALIWVISLTTLGFVLGEHPWVNQNLEWTLIAILILATLPLVINAFSLRLKKAI